MKIKYDGLSLYFYWFKPIETVYISYVSNKIGLVKEVNSGKSVGLFIER